MAEQSPPEAPRNTWLLFLGVGLGAAGAGVLFAQRRNYLPDGDITTYSGLGLLLAGMAGCYLSGLPTDKVIDWVKSAVFALLVALTIRWSVAEPYRIPSSSMEPTLHGVANFFQGDRVFVNKWIYGLRWPFLNKRIFDGKAPERWDIVVFKTVEPDAVHPTLVKRIVGLPGETISIHDGKVFANGEALVPPPGLPADLFYTSNEFRSGMKYGVRPEPEFSQAPLDHYLMLGDNSANSRDGRYFGWLPRENMVGRVSCIWWPPQRARDFTGFTHTLWWRGLLYLLGAFIFVRLFIGQSWPVLMNGSRSVRHIFVSFVSLGLRLPFAGIRLITWRKPQRGELVLYSSKDEHVPEDALLFGRVAGLPGETVEIEDGKLLVNGQVMALPCFAPGMNYDSPNPDAMYGRNKKNTTVPEGAYFLLADPPDEANALDSRLIGWVPQGKVIGVAKWVWWPLPQARRL